MSCPPPPEASVPQSYLYVAINLQAILYGVNLVLYFRTLHVFLRRSPHRTSDTFYAIFTTIMLVLVTISVATSAYYGQAVWVLNPDYPGGPAAYGEAHLSEWYNLLGSVVAIILQQMTDGLMIHRVRLVWNSHRVIVIPCVLWLATLALGIVLCWVSNMPGETLFIKFEARFALAYYSLSMFLNFTLTCSICSRVLLHARSVRKLIGAEYSSPFMSIVILVVESALPFTLCGIVFVVSFGLGNPLGIVFSRMYTLMMAISPQMLILRVAEGNAWGNSVRQPPSSTIKFSPVSISGQTGGGSELDALGVEKISVGKPPSCPA